MDQPGKHFMLGFRDRHVPLWLKNFAGEFGLGGVILFDYDVLTKKYERNIFEPNQVKELCQEIHELPSGPKIYIDQEGGKVRRLKEKLGFKHLPSAKNFPSLDKKQRELILYDSFLQMKNLGIDVNLAPVIDVDYNPENPDLGKVERCFSADISVVRESALAYISAAKKVGLELCLKHFPGMGGAKVNSHDELMDITDCIHEDQIDLFQELLPQVPGKMVLVSHGLIQDWEKDIPASMSKVALNKIKKMDKNVKTITDDIQMQGLQKAMSTKEACVRAIQAGADLLCIGNNLLDEQEQCFEFAEATSKIIK